MPRPTNVSHVMAAPTQRAAHTVKPRALMSDAERAARGRAQIAAEQCLDDDDLDAFLDDLRIPATKA